MDAARVAVIGVGGLGAPAAAALARAGVALTLFDPDRIELSNLPRQPLFGAEDVGRPKVEVAAERLRTAHPGISVDARAMRVDDRLGAAPLAGHRALLDATDGLEAKVLLNEIALELGVPLVHAGVLGLDGQLMTIVPGATACLRCLFVEVPSEDEVPGCQQAGILGPVVGAVGFAAAREAHALATGRTPPLWNRLAILDGARLRWRVIELKRNPRCPSCALRGPIRPRGPL